MIRTTLFLFIVSFLISCVKVEKHPLKPELVEDAFHFYIIGDWGRNGQFNQKEVAAAMNKVAATIEPEFIISTGDNFYPDGIASIQDPLWKTSYEDVYDGHLLFCPWYVVLGNHDYRGSIDAEIDYTHVSRRWNMPDRYYSESFISDEDSTSMLFAFTDTSPFEKKYYSEEKYKSVALRQDTTRQIQWIDSLFASSNSDWRFVIGHHPLYSGGKRLEETSDIRKSLSPILSRNQIDIYFAGHEHDMQHIKLDDQTHQIISGAGSEVRPTGMMDNSLFAVSEPGFVICSVNKSFALIQMINEKGELIYSSKISR